MTMLSVERFVSIVESITPRECAHLFLDVHPDYRQTLLNRVDDNHKARMFGAMAPSERQELMAYLPIECSKIANGPRRGFRPVVSPRKHHDHRSPEASPEWLIKIKSEGSLSPRRFENYSSKSEDRQDVQIAALERRIQALTNQVEQFQNKPVPNKCLQPNRRSNLRSKRTSTRGNVADGFSNHRLKQRTR